MKTHTKLAHITIFRIESEISLNKIIEYHNTLKNALDSATKKWINILNFVILSDITLIMYILINVLLTKPPLHNNTKNSVCIGIILLGGGLWGLLKVRKQAVINYHKKPLLEELLKRCQSREYVLKSIIHDDLSDAPSETTLNFLREKRIIQ